MIYSSWMAPLVSLFLLLSPPLRCHDNVHIFVEGKKLGKKNMMRHTKAPPKAQRKLQFGKGSITKSPKNHAPETKQPTTNFPTAPTMSPTDSPTMFPSPSVEPTEDYCVDDSSFLFFLFSINSNYEAKDCAWLSMKYTRKLYFCNVKSEVEKKKIKYFCKEACGQFISRCSFPTAAPTAAPTVSPAPTMSPTDSPTDSPTMFPSPSPSSTPSSNPTVECVDDNETTFEIKEGKVRDCQWLSEKAKRSKKYCEVKGVLKDHLGYAKIKYTCRGTCKQFLKFCFL